MNEYMNSEAFERENICGDLSETTVFKSYSMKHEQKANMMLSRSHVYTTYTYQLTNMFTFAIKM